MRTRFSSVAAAVFVACAQAATAQQPATQDITRGGVTFSHYRDVSSLSDMYISDNMHMSTSLHTVSDQIAADESYAMFLGHAQDYLTSPYWSPGVHWDWFGVESGSPYVFALLPYLAYYPNFNSNWANAGLAYGDNGYPFTSFGEAFFAPAAASGQAEITGSGYVFTGFSDLHQYFETFSLGQGYYWNYLRDDGSVYFQAFLGDRIADQWGDMESVMYLDYGDYIVGSNAETAPEPSTFILIASGLVVIAVIRRRQQGASLPALSVRVSRLRHV